MARRISSCEWLPRPIVTALLCYDRTMPEVDHAYVHLTLPDQWEVADAPGDLFARFCGPSGAELSLMVSEVQGRCEPRALVDKLMLAHDGILRSGSSSFDATPPVDSHENMLVSVHREHRVGYPAGDFHAVTRYAVTEGPVMARGGPFVHVAIRVSVHAPEGTDPAWLRWLVDAVTLLPALTQSESLFPSAMAEGATELERFLFSFRRGSTIEELQRAHPEQGFAHDARARGYVARPAAARPFRQVVLELEEGGLRAVKLTETRVGDYAVLEALDEELRQALPSVELRSMSQPWSVTAARKILEGRGKARMSMATPIIAEVPGRGRISGKAVAFKPRGEQGYGIELRWFPE